MGLNFEALKNLEGDLKRKSGDVKDLIYTKDLKEETDFKIAPPFPDMDGVYVVEQIIWWIKKKPYTSLLTWGEDCPLKEETEIAESDSDLKELIDDSDNFKAEKSQYLIPGYLLDVKYNDDNEIESVKVVDDKGKLLQSNITLLKRINACVTSRQAGKDITDNNIGYPLVLTKKGEKLDTEYNAMMWVDHLPLEDKYYEDEKHMPISPWKFLGDLKEDPEYLRGVIRNYLYGEDMPKKENTGKASTEDKPKGRAVRAVAPSGGEEDKPVKRKIVSSEPKEEKSVSTEEVPVKKKTPSKSGGRLLDAISNLDG